MWSWCGLGCVPDVGIGFVCQFFARGVVWACLFHMVYVLDGGGWVVMNESMVSSFFSYLSFSSLFLVLPTILALSNLPFLCS